jgi:addiction module HigA family antidote
MHPGELLREDIVPALGKDIGDLADLLGISRQTFSAILHERARVTADMALRLGKLCGNGPRLWINLQAHYDLEHIDPRTRSAIERIPTLAPAEAT